jgi:hypothetical protein
MNVLFARFALLLVIASGIALTAWGHAHSRNADQLPTLTGSPTTSAVTDEAIPRESAPASGTRVIRWQSFLPGTFR